MGDTDRMSERGEHRPTFGWLTRRPDPDRPLDGAYVQRHWVRLHRPGPWRLAGVGVLVLLTTVLAMLTLVSLSGAGGLLTRLVVMALGGVLLAATFALTLRVFTAGVHVTDQAVRVSGVRRHRTLPWTDVVDVRRLHDTSPLLGVLPRTGATRVVMVVRGGDDVDTGITTVSSDFLGRAEAFDIAALALERWWQDAQRAA
mgnify:CR=1 FL=1